MRLLSGLLFIALTASTAIAEEAKPADPKPEVTKREGGRKVPLRVVRMLPETHQVLLLDKNRGTHVAAEVGQEVDGYIVDEIDADEVTLIAPSGAEIILTAPDTSWRRRAAERKAAATKAGAAGASAAAGATAGPVDPYADAPATSVASDIAAGEGGVRVASAGPAASSTPTATPIIDAGAPALGIVDPYADSVPSPSPSPSPSPTSTTSTPTPTPSTVTATATDTGPPLVRVVPVTPTTTAPSVAPSSGDATATVSRAAVNAALDDFGATAVTFNAAFVADGLRIDSIAAGTILAKVGLRAGDVITSVDGQPLKSFDDAADLYARASTAKTSTLKVMRGGKPVTLRVVIQ